MRQLFALIGSEMNCYIDIERQLEYYCRFLEKRKVEQLVRAPLAKSKRFFNVMQQQSGMPFGISNALCSAFPLYGDIAGMVYGSAPNTKILYIIGNPILRYMLHYVTENCLRNPQSIFQVGHIIKESTYAYMGLYINQIRQYTHYFGEDPVYVCVLEDLLTDPDGEFDKIYDHIGLENGLPVVETMEYDSLHILESLQNDVRYASLYSTLQKYYNDSIELLGDYLERDMFSLWNIPVQ